METVLLRGELMQLTAELATWPEAYAPEPSGSTLAQRFRNASRDAVDQEDAVGRGDLAALLRHVLRSAEEMGDPATIGIPSDPAWPSAAELRSHGISFGPSAKGLRRLAPLDWHPEWLGPEAQRLDPAAGVFGGALVRPREPIPADPFFYDATSAQFGGYLSPGQREAVRTLALSPPGASIIATLPTGSGKSVIAYLPALAAGRGLVVVVVPTTALAIDQERAFRELVERAGRGSTYPRELAYHGDLSTEVREEVRQRIGAGDQRIVFSSPESLVGSLAPSLFKAAEAGSLRLFAVDEAHIVDEWGADFRPEFQQLGALRHALHAASPDGIKSLFLSGTFTDETVRTLRRLFGSEDEYVISAMDLRAEPAYWPAFAESREVREEWVLDAIRHLPRPLVLYATTQEDVAYWGDRVRGLGYLRSDVVYGATTASKRREVIEKLRSLDLDLVVASSAFGLGVDQPDIRAVVHACMPETLNRYYQEVGRGGRDGRHSISVLVACDEDRLVAESLVRETLIGEDKGRKRWGLMRDGAEHVPDRPGQYRVPIDVVPPWLKGDSDENRAWNTRTLLLMDRAGLIQMHAQQPPRLPQGEPVEEWQSALDDYARHALISIAAGNLLADEAWEPFRQVRQRAAAGGSREHRRMLSIFEEGRSVCSEFVDTYTLTEVADEEVPPGRTCAGCPGCRSENCVPRLHPLAQPQPTSGLRAAWAPELAVLLSGEHVLVVPYERDDWPDRILSASGRLPNVGIRSIYAEDELRASRTLQDLHVAHGPVCLSELPYLNLTAPLVPTALLLGPNSTPLSAHLSNAGPSRLVFCEGGMPHPNHPTATISEFSPSVVSLHEFLARF